jgi:transposase-like protein
MRKIKEEMDALPENTWLSREYGQRWGGRLCIDGKYIAVKGYEKKVVFLYCIDYLTHDIPVGILAPSENEHAFNKLFSLLKASKYNLQIVICDDVLSSLKPAMLRFYPNAKIQLCLKHYLENVKGRLKIDYNKWQERFFYSLRGVFFTRKRVHHFQRQAYLRDLFRVYASRDDVIKLIMIEVSSRWDELFAFTREENHCPNTNNLIEAFNSHLQGRLKSVKGFNSWRGAERWLNAWMIRRRTKPFTDCSFPFKHLNGKMSLEIVLKKDSKFPKILGVKHPI